MAGNSQRKGAMRNAGSKKGATVGSGGQRRKALKGKGPTPKAKERTGHPAARRARAAEKSAARSTSRGGKRSDGREVLVGRNPVVEALRANVPASALYVQQFVDTDERVREALTLAADRGLPLLEVARPELDRMSGGAVHQGLLLTVPAYDYLDPDDLLARAIESGTTPLLVALDGVTDPRNLGAIVRSAAAFGAQGVLVPERRAAGVTGSAWKASAGTLARVPVARATNLTRALQAYRKAGCTVMGLAADGELDLTELTADMAGDPLVIVVGGEGKGLSRLVSEACDHLMSIPMTDAAESLNAAVAAGVTLYAVAALRA